MQSISTIGLDIAKSVFQVHGVDAAGQVVLRRQLRRRHVLAFFQKLAPCLVGIEALMPPAYVKPYVKRQKNDSTDAEAICEAVTRPNMRFVPTKTVEQQSCLMLHRARHALITAMIGAVKKVTTKPAQPGQPPDKKTTTPTVQTLGKKASTDGGAT